MKECEIMFYFGIRYSELLLNLLILKGFRASVNFVVSYLEVHLFLQCPVLGGLRRSDVTFNLMLHSSC
jgi:hypothetical protein